MPELRRNLELKARCPDLAGARRAAAALGAARAGGEAQRDTFFNARAGRLKLREKTCLNEQGEALGSDAELIWYERADASAVRSSRYVLAPAPDPAALLAALTAANGVRGAVVKRRELWLWHNVRIHLDAVEGLGDFVEFEAVMRPGEDDATSEDRLSQLRAALRIADDDLISVAYADLLGL